MRTVSLTTARKLSALAQEPTRVLRWSRPSRQALRTRCLALYNGVLRGTLTFEGVAPEKQSAAELRLARICRTLVHACDAAQYVSYDELLDRDLPVA